MKGVLVLFIGVVIFTACGSTSNVSVLCDEARESCSGAIECKVSCCDTASMNAEECLRAVSGQGYPDHTDWFDCVQKNNCDSLN